MKKYDLAVFIGRFQPFHSGHLHIVEEAKQVADSVLILVGSVNSYCSTKNPWSYEERVQMIKSCADVHTAPIPDFLYNEEKWICAIQEAVASVCPNGKVCLVGHSKDESSYYLKSFPQWDCIEVENYNKIDATTVRNAYFSGAKNWNELLPVQVASYLEGFAMTPRYKDLVAEVAYYKKEMAKFENYPYKNALHAVCSDSVVVCNGHILLIQRKANPGKGCWALPGGHKENTETFLQGALRELKEETRLKVPQKVLVGSLQSSHLFDYPKRTLVFCKPTMAYFFKVEGDYPSNTLPKVHGSDDASKAEWVSLSDVKSLWEQGLFFDDHAEIIDYFCKVL